MNQPMRSVEPLNQERAAQRVEKFGSIKDCVERLATLKSEHFKPHQRGIGARDREIAALTKKLRELQNPLLPL
jgi:hypothetical protein